MTNFKVTILDTRGKTMECGFEANSPQDVLKQIARDDFTTAENEPERGERFGKVEAVHRNHIVNVTVEEI